MSALLALLLAQVTPASGSPPPPAAETVDAERLTAARRAVEAVFPASQREPMMAAMVGSMTASTKAAIEQQPDVIRLIQREPRARPIFDQFLQSQQAESVTRMQANLPGMLDAMSRAYARRFTVAQLGELQTFFKTPTGRTYVAQSATIMSDPDVSAWQGRMMADNLASLGPGVRDFVEQLMALAPAGKAK